MSSPETITTCLETSIKLVKSGYKKDTVFVWAEFYNTSSECKDKMSCLEIKGSEEYFDMKDRDYLQELTFYPAPTSSEIELPMGTYVSKLPNGYLCVMIDSKDGKSIWYKIFKKRNEEFQPESFWAKTEIEAKAKMWLYLKEKGLI